MTPQEEAKALAQDEARHAIQYAHLMTVVCLLVADMQQAGVLRPSTKTKILDALREGHDSERSRESVEALHLRLRQQLSFQERGQKRQAQKLGE